MKFSAILPEVGLVLLRNTWVHELDERVPAEALPPEALETVQLTLFAGIPSPFELVKLGPLALTLIFNLCPVVSAAEL